VSETIPADILWQAQSPQVFKYGLLMKAYEKALEDKFVSKDDSSFVERIGAKVKVVECPYENIKIFKPFDLQVAKVVGKKAKENKP
jgi:2-C-methyl-D-erythritol 4-phosphate cytidylyltransferase